MILFSKCTLKNITSIHSNATRTQHKIHLLKPNHEYAKYCIQYIPIVVNSTPNNIITKIYSLQGFSAHIKHFLQSH